MLSPPTFGMIPPKTLLSVVVATITFGDLYQSPYVTGQSFRSCFPTITGLQCRWSGRSPLVLTSEYGLVTLGSESFIYSYCTDTTFSASSCECQIIVDPDPVFLLTDAECKSCTFLSVTETSFSIYYDCSNRIVGECAAFDENGCDPPKAPTRAPIQPAPRRAPTSAPVRPAPRRVPTRAPIRPAPRRVPTSAPRRPAPRHVPTRAPIRPSPRQVPTRAPIRPAPRRVPAPAPRQVPRPAPRRVPVPTPIRVPANPSQFLPGQQQSVPDTNQFPTTAPHQQSILTAPQHLPTAAPVDSLGGGVHTTETFTPTTVSNSIQAPTSPLPALVPGNVATTPTSTTTAGPDIKSDGGMSKLSITTTGFVFLIGITMTLSMQN